MTQPSGTSAPDTSPPGIEAERVGAFFARHVAGGDAPLAFEILSGGRSNLTYLVSTRTQPVRRFVLRRPPLGHVLPTAHDMVREHRVLSALADTDVPVARPLALCEDPDVTGAPFYVMEYRPGVVVERELPRGFAGTKDERRRALARARRHTGASARRRRGARRALRLRPPRRLPRAAGAALVATVGALEDAGAARHRRAGAPARGVPARLPRSHAGARRLPAGQSGARRRRSRPGGGDLRLGDGDPRRSALGPRLHAHLLGGAGRSRCLAGAGHAPGRHRAAGLPLAGRAGGALRAATAGATSRPSTSTRCWRSSSSPSSAKASTRASSWARPSARASRASAPRWRSSPSARSTSRCAHRTHGYEAPSLPARTAPRCRRRSRRAGPHRTSG